MLGSEIIAKFNLYVDDSSELSSTEELALLNKIYRKVLDEKDWEFLKKEYAGTTSTSVPYIDLPSDFKSITVNYNDDTDGPEQVVFVGSNFQRKYLIPFAERRLHRDADGWVYIDARQSRLYFTKQPTSAEAVEYDYIYNPDNLTTGTSPVFPERFHDILVHGMVVDFYSIEQTEKDRSYYKENLVAYEDYLERMGRWNMKQYGSLNY